MKKKVYGGLGFFPDLPFGPDPVPSSVSLLMYPRCDICHTRTDFFCETNLFLKSSTCGNEPDLPTALPDAQMASERSATCSETSQIDSAMARDVPMHPHAPSGDDRSACKHSRAFHRKIPVSQ